MGIHIWLFYYKNRNFRPILTGHHSAVEWKEAEMHLNLKAKKREPTEGMTIWPKQRLRKGNNPSSPLPLQMTLHRLM